MIICANCKNQEIDGALFCSECGAQLAGHGAETQKFSGSMELSANSAPMATKLSHSANTWITLHLVDSGDTLPIVTRTEFSLGRISEDQPIEPDVDLAPYQAFQHGVSRLHAIIRYNGGNVVIEDLGSSNGTYINGVRIVPNIENHIHNGDMIALGKLKIQIALP